MVLRRFVSIRGYPSKLYSRHFLEEMEELGEFKYDTKIQSQEKLSMNATEEDLLP